MFEPFDRPFCRKAEYQNCTWRPEKYDRNSEQFMQTKPVIDLRNH
jgi:hypothetical protein